MVFTGSGSGQVGPVTFDQPYYILKAKYDSTDEYAMLQVSYKMIMGGTEVEKNVLFAGKGARSSGFSRLRKATRRPWISP